MLEGLLKDCWQIEDIAAQIYMTLAANSVLPEQLRSTFTTLARDEMAHAAQLDQAIRLQIELPGVIKRIAWSKVEEALQLARRLHLELCRTPCDASAAMQLAIRLEKNFVKVHLENALFFEDERVAALFRGLARADEEHLQTLTDCLHWWRQFQTRTTGEPD